MTGLKLVAKFFGPEVAQKEAEDSGLSPEDAETAISAGVKETKEIPA
ncbi:hypothetical protein HZB97_00160 [Candidatus Gottesmanbacteria bacterium]|nr:hypothetical protein [Candidatus Gottesmanbacteria bacterium]